MYGCILPHPLFIIKKRIYIYPPYIPTIIPTNNIIIVIYLIFLIVYIRFLKGENCF